MVRLLNKLYRHNAQVALVAGIACSVAIALGLWTMRARAARASACRGMLTQIAWALEGYHQHYGTLPPAYIADASGRRLHSWRVLILPFWDSGIPYEKYHFDEPWNGPRNSALASAYGDRSPFLCPSDTDDEHTSYVVVVGQRTLWHGDTPVRIDPGSRDEVLVVEVHGSGIHWMEPRDIEYEDALDPNSPVRPRLEHTHGSGFHYVNAALHAHTFEGPLESSRLTELLNVE